MHISLYSENGAVEWMMGLVSTNISFVEAMDRLFSREITGSTWLEFSPFAVIFTKSGDPGLYPEDKKETTTLEDRKSKERPGEVKYKCSPFTEEQKKDIDLNKKTIGQIPYEKKVCEKTKNNRYVIN